MKKLYEEENIQDIANSIRNKNGTQTLYTTSDMAAAIDDLPVAGNYNVTVDTSIGYSSGSDIRYLITECGDIDTSNLRTMENFFSYCKNLIAIPLLNTSNVTSMASMCTYCEKLETIAQLNTSNVTSMQNMFMRCYALQTIPLFNTSNVTVMSNMFNTCDSLTSVPLLNTSNVTNMQSMFDNCVNLTSVPQLDTSKAVYLQRMFNYCRKLTTVPQFDWSSAVNVSDMFKDCPLLSDNSLNNILASCITLNNGTKKLYGLGLYTSVYPVSRYENLSNYQAFLNAGWAVE